MRLRGHHIRKIRAGWLVQPIKLQPGDKPSQIVDDFTTAAQIALPAAPACIVLTDVRIYLPGTDFTTQSAVLTISAPDQSPSIPTLLELTQ